MMRLDMPPMEKVSLRPAGHRAILAFPLAPRQGLGPAAPPPCQGQPAGSRKLPGKVTGRWQIGPPFYRVCSFYLFIVTCRARGRKAAAPGLGPGSKLGRQSPLPARRPYHGQMGRACFSGKFQNPLKRKTKYSILINKFMFLYTRIHVSNLCYPAAQGAGNALVPPLL